jgi:hypothetical protein
MSGEAMRASLRSGRASFHRHHMAIPDFHDFLNAVSPHPTRRPAHASFDVHWRGDPDRRRRIRDETFGFKGTFVPCEVTISFRVSDDQSGVVYTSVAEGQTTVGGGIGHEQNGRFFHD